MDKRKYLGIGINSYPSSPLNGCIPDIDLATKIAKEKYNMVDISILKEKNANKKRIIESLKTFFTGVGDTDKLYIHYSGHGSYERAKNPKKSKETDEYNEGWVPYDYQYHGLVLDDELNQLIMNVNPKATLLIISDSCFSGTVARGEDGNPHYKWKNKSIPPHNLADRRKELTIEEELLCENNKCSLKSSSSFIVDTKDEQSNAILISGCGEKQTSADIYIPEISTYHGALTYNLFKVLAKHQWSMTYQDLVTQVNIDLRNDDYEQISQLECRKSLWTKNFLS
jgi:metacaspase-1